MFQPMSLEVSTAERNWSPIEVAIPVLAFSSETPPRMRFSTGRGDHIERKSDLALRIIKPAVDVGFSFFRDV